MNKHLWYNIPTEHMFRLEAAVHERTGLAYWSAGVMPLHSWYLGFCHVLAAAAVAILIRRSGILQPMTGWRAIIAGNITPVWRRKIPDVCNI